MDYSLFKLAHFVSLGGMVWSFGSSYLKRTNKAFIAFTFFWLMVLATSFGLVDALGLHENFPAWAQKKFHIWILMGIMVLLMKLKPRFERVLVPVMGIFLVGAIYLAVYKP